MHVSSVRDPVEIRWRDSVLSVAKIFLGEYSLHAEGILFLEDCAVGLWGYSECDEANSHIWYHWTPIKTAQGNRSLMTWFSTGSCVDLENCARLEGNQPCSPKLRSVSCVDFPTVDHLVMQCTKSKHLIYFYKQLSGSLIEHEQHQAWTDITENEK